MKDLLAVIGGIGAAILGLLAAVMPLLGLGYVAYMYFSGKW